VNVHRGAMLVSARRLQDRVAVGAIGLLAALCIVGAFLGAERARAMFNSGPAVVFWFVTAGLLAARLLSGVGSPRSSPALFAALLGALLVVGGGMCASETGHRLAAWLFGKRKVPSGYMLLPVGAESNRLFDAEFEREVGRLPFSLRLRRFWIDYFREEGGPAVSGAVRNYNSHVLVVTDGQEVTGKVISVNHPLHYGGYHFYQFACDPQGRAYTVLLVRSDSGLGLVLAGFGFLCVGVVWCCWGRPLRSLVLRRGKGDGR